MLIDSIQKHSRESQHQNHLLVEGMALAVGAAVLLDHRSGARTISTHRTNPEFYTARLTGAQHTLGVLPGCQMDGKMLFDAVSARVPEGTLIMTDYPKKGFDIEAVCEGLANQLRANRAERPSLICQSMGGMVMRHFVDYADRTGLAEQMGGFGTIVLDASPFDGSDIQMKYRLILGAVAAARNSWAANYIKPRVMRHGSHEWSAPTTLEAIDAQGSFMINDKHPTSVRPGLIDQLVYIHSDSPDPVINTSRALPKWQQYSPTGVHEIIDYTRVPGSHTADINQYDLLIQQGNVRQLQDQSVA